MLRTTQIMVEADIQIWVKGDPAGMQEIKVHNIPCTWEWDKSSRASAEIWAVHDWVDNTFGDNAPAYWIVCVVGSPVREEEDPYAHVEAVGMEVLNAMVGDEDVVWGD